MRSRGFMRSWTIYNRWRNQHRQPWCDPMHYNLFLAIAPHQMWTDIGGESDVPHNNRELISYLSQVQETWIIHRTSLTRLTGQWKHILSSQEITIDPRPPIHDYIAWNQKYSPLFAYAVSKPCKHKSQD